VVDKGLQLTLFKNKKVCIHVIIFWSACDPTITTEARVAQWVT